MKTSHIIACALFAGSLVLARAAQADTTLDQYRDIVVAPEASTVVKNAAEDLQYHLQKIAGRPFPLVIPEAAAKEGLHFFVGSNTVQTADAAIKALPLEGWMIRSVPQGLLVAGNDQGPVKNFVFDHSVPLFLEKYCGVRWLWPGESGEIIPHNPRLALPTLNESGAPALKRRKMTFGYSRYWSPGVKKTLQTWLARSLQGDQINANFGHAWATVIPPAMYFEKHPEWFGLVNGKRETKQLCISNPQLRDEFFKRLMSLPANQKLDIVSVSANDGAGFCECDLCKAKGSIGDSYWDFVNDMAQRVKKAKPSLGVGTFAYTFGRQPPGKIDKLPDNVFLSMTTYSTQMMLPEGLKEYEDFTTRWKSKGVKIMMREYWGMHYWLDLPILYPEEIGQTIKFGRDAGMMGAYGETGKNWSTQALNSYVLTHMMWDPDADPKAIMADFYAAFGPAEKPVRAYFETLQNSVNKVWNQNKPEVSYAQLAPLYSLIFTPEVMSQATAHLNEAYNLAGEDAALKERISFLRIGCDYTSLMGELIGLYARLAKPSSAWLIFQPGRVFTSATGATITTAPALKPVPPPLTSEQRKVALERAWELGQRRIEMLNENRENFALDEGLYAFTIDREQLRPWHQAVGKELGKGDNEIVPLTYTHIPKKPERTPAKKAVGPATAADDGAMQN